MDDSTIRTNISIKGAYQDSVWGAVISPDESHPNLFQINADSVDMKYLSFKGDKFLGIAIVFGTSVSKTFAPQD